MIAAREKNRRILVIDDNEAIHEDYRKVLIDSLASKSIDEYDLELFGESSASAAPAKEIFEIDSAYQGEEGLQKVELSLLANRPYAMAFVDMRMPPGWDGLKTIERIRMVDKQLQIVICTAFSDHTWQEIVTRVQQQDSLMILKKPFESIEVKQLASSLTEKWQLTLEAMMTMDEMDRRIREQTKEIILARDLALEALHSMSSSWLKRDKETLLRFLERLRRRNESQAEKFKSGEQCNRRRAKRNQYESEVTVFIPNHHGKDEPLFKVLSRDISGTGLSFVYHSEIVSPEIVALLEMEGQKPVICHGRIVRSVKISQNLWEYGLEFVKKSMDERS